MKIEVINDKVKKLTADEGYVFKCNYHQCVEGNEVWTGYVYYDNDSNLLETPYLLTEADYEEITIEEAEELEKELHKDEEIR